MLIELIIFISALVIIFTLEGIFPYFQGRVGRFRHAAPNIALAILGGLIGGLASSRLITGGVSWAECCPFGLLHAVRLPPLFSFIIAFVLFDFWMYLWHVAVHRIRPLWRFHRVHHIDTEMDCTTALRFHPLEVAAAAFLRVGILIILGMSVAQLFIYVVLFHIVILFHHSNIALPSRWDRILRALIVTPNMHRVHHSIEGREFNSNYGSIFSFWDRLIRTFRRRENTLTIIYGLRIFREEKWQTLPGMLINPFR